MPNWHYGFVPTAFLTHLFGNRVLQPPFVCYPTRNILKALLFVYPRFGPLPMLRWVSYCLDFIGGCVVLLAPVVILHWLLVAFNVVAVTDALQPLTAALNPAYDVLNSIYPFPVASAGLQTVSTAPLALGLMLLFTFFVLSLSAGMLRQWETQLSAAQRPNYSQQTAQRQQQQQWSTQQAALQRSAVVVWLEFPFAQFPQSGQLLSRFSHYTGQEIPSAHLAPPGSPSPRGKGVVFHSAEKALSYAQQSVEKLQAYYSGLSSAETQPPARLVIDASTPAPSAIQQSVARCQFIARYCQPNQVLFSQQLYERLQAENIHQQFSHYSTGVYQLPNEPPQDLYCLETQTQSLFF